MEEFNFGLEELVELVEDYWKVDVTFDYETSFRGLCDPETNTIYIYPQNIKDEDDYNITLIHELIHAYNDKLPELYVENKAIDVYKNFPEISDLAMDLFNVERYKIWGL